MSEIPMTESCKRILARQKLDKKHGHTTSDATVDFIRRSCPCEVCIAWRAARRSLQPTSHPW